MVPTFNKGAIVAGIKHGYRSGLEERNADEYIANGISARFEPIRIKYEIRRNTTYTPDFIQWNAVIIETKGRFMSKDRSKHLMLQKQHPALDIRFVFSNSRARLNKTSKTTNADWCDKHGFPWATKLVPAAWTKEPINQASYKALAAMGYDWGEG